MKQFSDKAVILTRTDFGEADRIITFLTARHGKVKAIAKAVRKSKSKLAGGIELFSVSDITVIVGRGEINTLISTRLVKHYANIVKDLARTQLAYEFIRLLNKNTETAAEFAYFKLIKTGFEALDDSSIDPELTALWFNMQLLKIAGHAPNLRSDSRGAKLKSSATYGFRLDDMHFAPQESAGDFTEHHIKFLRVGFAARGPRVLARVVEASKLAEATQPLIQTMLKSSLRV